jgi:hypothetical protein
MSAFSRMLGLAAIGAVLAALSSAAVARDESGAQSFARAHKATTANFFKTSLDDVTGAIDPMPRPRKVKRSRSAVAMAPAIVRPAAVEATLAPVLTGWEQAILNDQSLRRGDIVMFSAGPKVFTGATRKAPWTLTDFEDLATTKAMANRARDALLASIGKPADEAPNVAEGASKVADEATSPSTPVKADAGLPGAETAALVLAGIEVTEPK